jgi:hypothetical protein
MSSTPDPAWKVPANTWAEVIGRYTHHRQVKTWRGRTHAADGQELPDHLEPTAAARLGKKLLTEIERRVRQGELPRQPNATGIDLFDALLKAEGYDGLAALKCPEWIGHIRKAVVWNRDGYTCRYCRRTAWSVYAESGRTLRFELDHSTARSRLIDCNDFDLANIVTACRSCNLIKGQMELQPFLAELRSLAQAVIRIEETEGGKPVP